MSENEEKLKRFLDPKTVEDYGLHFTVSELEQFKGGVGFLDELFGDLFPFIMSKGGDLEEE
jgi:hypothetical protein